MAELLITPPWLNQEEYYDHLEQDHDMLVKRGPFEPMKDGFSIRYGRERESVAEAKARKARKREELEAKKEKKSAGRSQR